MSESSLATLAQLVQSLLMVPYGQYPVLYPAWSLTLIVEFGLILALGRAISKYYAVAFSILMTTFIVGMGFVFRPTNQALAMYSNPILMDFAIGAAFALVVPRIEPLPKTEKRVLALILLAVGVSIAISAPLLLGDQLKDRLFRLLTLGVGAGMIVSASLLSEMGGWALKSRWIDRITKYAFCIYLCHIFWNIGVEKVATMASTVITVALLIVTPVAVTTIAALSYHLIEEPISRWLGSKGPWFRRAADPR